MSPSTQTAAIPTRTHFEPWNSSSTGHQHAENRLSGSPSWRESRTMKLGHQFRSGADGGKRVYDSVGAGSRDFGRDGRKDNGRWENGARGLREKGAGDLRRWIGGVKKIKRKTEKEQQDERGEWGEEEAICKVTRLRREEREKWDQDEAVTKISQPQEDKSQHLIPTLSTQNFDPCQNSSIHEPSHTLDPSSPQKPSEKKIFSSLTIYINGSTGPLVSDHKLKYLLAEHGARISIALGRRSVTHVILGTPNGKGTGAGGGLAAGKIQKEVQRVGGKGVKFVGVEWVLESIRAGTRLPEARFSNLNTGGAGQRSVLGMFGKSK